MKRIVSLILALSMVLSMFTMSFAGTSLKDIEGKKYQAAVEALIELGVVSGYPDGTYLPEKVVTRAELAKLLVVAYGLETAAESAKGVTPFADINAVANHWAAGYINVSADYKFVNGYPDGSFKADTPVTYAEAITMCLRVLGYANEIDAKGTWPTNYIAKAQDLKLMEDIDFASYNAGAKRGDIALLIWNMLRTKMWTVESESEGDGLVSKPKDNMLTVKFKDYTYSEEGKFKSWSYNADEEKVYVTLENAGSLEYDKNDFYTLVPGTEVSVLYKNTKKDDVLLSIVPNDDNVLVDGTSADLNEKYVPTDKPTYAYLLLASNKKSAEVSGKVELNGAASEYVLKVEEKSNYTRVKTTTLNRSIKDDAKADDLVLFGNERISLTDLKVGDVITKIAEHVYVLSRETVEGTFNSLTYEEDSEDTRNFIELGKDEYDVIPANLTIAKVNEKDEEEFDDVDVAAALKKDSKKVAYAFVEGESTSDDKDFGIVEKVTIREEKYYITVNDTKYEAVGMNANNKPAQGSIIAYTIDSKDRIKVAFEYKVDELVNAARVTKVDDSFVSFSNHEDIDLELLPDSATYEDYRVFNITVRYDDSDPIFESIEEGKLDSIVVKKDYGMAESAKMKVIAVIDGIEWGILMVKIFY